MSEYGDAAARAREEALASIRATDKQIADIYRQAVTEITRRANSAKEGSLTQRWALDMRQSLKTSITRLTGDIESTITGAAESASKLPGNVAGDWLHSVYTKAGGSLAGDTFRNMFTKTSDDALRMVLSGRAYLDGKSLSGRIWTQTGRLENGINQVIQQGIAQKKSAVQIARELEQYVNPDARETLRERRDRMEGARGEMFGHAPLQFPGNIEYNCLRLARTSINHAYFLSMKNSAKLNPFCNAVHWELSAQHFKRQVAPFGVDICDEYATHDEGLGIGNWPVDGVPLPHAQCLCSQWPDVPMSLDECAARLRRWLDGNADPELDSSFIDWRDALISGLPDRRLASIRDDAGEERQRLLARIAGRADIQGLSPEKRNEVISRLENTNLDKLRGMVSEDSLEGERLRNALNNLMGYDILDPENMERELRAAYPPKELDRGLRIADIEAQEWYKGLKPKERKAIAEVFENATDAELEFWQRHGGLVKGDFYADGERANYSPKTQRVTLNLRDVDLRAERAGWSSNLRAFFHETGHAFDALAYNGTSVTAEMPELRQKLERDFVGYANGILAKYKQAPIGGVSNMSTTQIGCLSQYMRNYDPNLRSSVSDLIEGLTNSKVQGRYGHERGYWKGNSLEHEAIAHMFECSMTKGERLQAFEEAFPETITYFKDTVSRLEGTK